MPRAPDVIAGVRPVDEKKGRGQRKKFSSWRGLRRLRVWVDVLDSSAGTAALPSPRSKKNI